MNIDTDDLEQRLFEACHDWMNGKPTNIGLFGPVQASARIFLARALTTRRIAESAGESHKLATDFDTWLQTIVASRLPEVKKKLGVEVKIPRH